MAKNPGHQGGEVPGGYGPTEEATEGFVILCYQLKTRAQAITKKIFENFLAVSYQAQPVFAGQNYIFKVLVGEENCIHMKVYWTVPCYGGGVVLLDIQENKTKTDPIVPF